jgi:tetratricopeptide (TPR) repeat protein
VPLLNRLTRCDDLRDQLRRTSELSQAGKYDEALELARGVEAACVTAKVESAHLYWAMAVMSDYAGKLPDALTYVLKALRADPLMLPAEQSLGIIVGRCRKKLVEAALDADEGVALYNALAENGLADDACRVAHAKRLHENGQNEEALQVAEAVALLSPRMADAWRIVGAAAAALGRTDLAAEASCRCEAARTDEGWEAVPPSAWGRA